MLSSSRTSIIEHLFFLSRSNFLLEIDCSTKTVLILGSLCRSSRATLIPTETRVPTGFAPGAVNQPGAAGLLDRGGRGGAGGAGPGACHPAGRIVRRHPGPFFGQWPQRAARIVHCQGECAGLPVRGPNRRRRSQSLLHAAPPERPGPDHPAGAAGLLERGRLAAGHAYACNVRRRNVLRLPLSALGGRTALRSRRRKPLVPDA